MVSRWSVFLLLVSSFPFIAGYSCSAPVTGDGSGPTEPAALNVIRCPGDGSVPVLDIAADGDAVFSCSVQLYEYGCSCPVQGEEAGAFVAVPPGSADAATVAAVCWSNAVDQVVTYDPNVGFLIKDCTYLGVWSSAAGQPQSFDSANAPEEGAAGGD